MSIPQTRVAPHLAEALACGLSQPAFTGQLSIEDFLTKRRIDSKDILYNPLSSEFGVTNYHQVEQLMVDEISTFKLVRKYCDCDISMGQSAMRIIE